MLATEGISKRFKDGVLLTFPDIQLEDQEQCVLIGDSGSGKTTFLHLLGGLISIEKGSIILNGKDLSEMKQSQMDVFRGQNIGLVFQKNYLISALNVYENIALAQRLAGVKEEPSWILEILEDLNIGHKSNDRIGSLSHGQAQRVAIARAMVNRPQLVLADEPTASLDDAHAFAAIEKLKSQAEKYEANLIIASHDQRVKEMFDQQIILPKHEHAQA